MIDVNRDGATGGALYSNDFTRLHIELEGIHPPITRELIVPKKAHLGWVHAVIQVAMGWANSHLHRFQQGDVIISDPTFNLNAFEGDPLVFDEAAITVQEVTKANAANLIYEYDFGDSWNHILTFKPLVAGQYPAGNRAVCIEGSRACPPEDCGSIPGYQDVLEALRNKEHPEHRAMKQWLGQAYDPEAFSIQKANRFLAKLPWPKVTAPQLGKILKAMDRAKT